MKYIALLGRLFYSVLFIMSGATGLFSAQKIAYAASQGVPLASFMVPLSSLIALLGGLSILVGYKSRYGAWLIVLFLVPVTLMMHQFWEIADPLKAASEQASFMKNIALIGAALLIAYFGSGPLSLDQAFSRSIRNTKDSR